MDGSDVIVVASLGLLTVVVGYLASRIAALGREVSRLKDLAAAVREFEPGHRQPSPADIAPAPMVGSPRHGIGEVGARQKTVRYSGRYSGSGPVVHPCRWDGALAACGYPRCYIVAGPCDGHCSGSDA